MMLLKLHNYIWHFVLHGFETVNCLFRKKSVCVIILTKSVDENRQIRRAIQGYRCNNSRVDFCVVESGTQLLDLDVKYYLKPDDDFHYNRFVCYALDAIPVETYDFVIISNDDVIPLSGAVDKLVSSGYKSCSPVDPSVIRTQKLKRPVIGYEIEYHLCGWCLCISTALLSTVSYRTLFNDRYRFFLQDVFYGKLLLSLKVNHAVVPSANVVHLEHRSHSCATSELLEYASLTQYLDHDVELAIQEVASIRGITKNT